MKKFFVFIKENCFNVFYIFCSCLAFLITFLVSLDISLKILLMITLITLVFVSSILSALSVFYIPDETKTDLTDESSLDKK